MNYIFISFSAYTQLKYEKKQCCLLIFEFAHSIQKTKQYKIIKIATFQSKKCAGIDYKKLISYHKLTQIGRELKSKKKDKKKSKNQK